jgi:DNA segregation ATPase FtsK/SpoIIIE-like protein
MAIASVIVVRRNLVRGALTLLGRAASGAREAQSRPRLTREQSLLAQAAGFVEAQFRQHGELVVGPISLLQRQYGLGYGAALDLAAGLEDAQVWSVYRDASGMRCARKVVRA